MLLGLKKRKKRQANTMGEMLLIEGNTSWNDAMQSILSPRYKYPLYRDGERRTPPNIWKIFGEDREVTGISHLLKVSSDRAAIMNRPPRLFAAFGWDQEMEPIFRDYHDIKHLLVSGYSGSGKTNGILALVLSMLWGNSPSGLVVHIFDRKRSRTLARLSGLLNYHHEASTFGAHASKLLEGLNESRKLLEQSDAIDIDEYNSEALKKKGKSPLKYNLIIVDDYGFAVADNKELEDTLNQIAAVGRNAGYYLLLAPQRADKESLRPLIKANVSNDLCFAQRDQVNAKIAGVPGAETLKGDGEAILAHDLKLDRIKTPLIEKYQVLKAISVLKKGGKIFKG